MKYLILFLLFLPMLATSQEISTQVEFDTLTGLHIRDTSTYTLQEYKPADWAISQEISVYAEIDTAAFSGAYVIQEYTGEVHWIMGPGPVITFIDGETAEVIGVCRIVEDGIIRYGFAVEAIRDKGTTLAIGILQLPSSDKSIWELLATKQK